MHKNTAEINRAMLLGDVVRVSFFVRNGSLQMGEECYFFLMSSMRKMMENGDGIALFRGVFSAAAGLP